jgi:hypothetical protein
MESEFHFQWGSQKLEPKIGIPNQAAVEIFLCLYVDNDAFIFSSREYMAHGLALIHKHFARFGLKMHISRAGAPSKTEWVPPPPPTSSTPSSPSQLQTVLMDVMTTMHSPMVMMHSPTTMANVRTLCGSSGRMRKCSRMRLKKPNHLISRMAVSSFAGTSSTLAPTFPLV